MSDDDSMKWLLSRAVQLLRTADQLHSQFFRLAHSDNALRWEPPADVFGGVDALGVVVAMPGVEPGRYQIMLEDEAVIVRATRTLVSNMEPGVIYRLEIPYGFFERRIQLPYGGYRLIDSQLENGCLRLRLERVE